MIIKVGETRFASGLIYCTPGAVKAVNEAEMSVALARHLQGDWGELDDDDIQVNNRALAEGGRLLSAYTTPSGVQFWIVTEPDRSMTSILLPEEY